MLSTNFNLVSPHLDLVSLVSKNPKTVTIPLKPGQQVKEIDFPMLRHFEQALESSDGKSLSGTKSPLRRNTQWSISMITSFESTAGPAFARIQERSTSFGSKSIKGLAIEYHEPQCMLDYNRFGIFSVSKE
jgi:hypothetical protein